MPAQILIVDDNENVRRGLRRLLAESPDWEVCGEAVNGLDAIDKSRQLKPDLILMDFFMPNMDGLEATRKITQTSPHPAILMLTMYMSRQLADEARRAGARGAMHKDEISRVVDALQALLRRESFFLPAK
ncbi:MAG: hypothetical protein DMG73_03540 [Acidobacteria bacterium]|jgi:DNA-binding NarL/FixJ family response regulator|nr:MAG: hypothetical protein DMG75_00315 [Acidobacteriota bacterium]PYX61413.1 MAG: hypothetical protein DMG73_03540 [Acidobacteriota bacterium]PYX66724.1 MAG: hypothetical protein DMG74_02905 [Acidobacteriota bacterium]